MIKNIHHIAIIGTDYKRSKHFYTQVLGLTVEREVYRKERDSYKLDLALNGHYVIELFSFPSPPPRPSWPEAAGLRHLAFAVDDIELEHQRITSLQIVVEDIRIDEYTGRQFFFFADPDGLPIEFYEG